MTLHDLSILKNVDLKEIDRDRIIDIKDIVIDMDKPKKDRIKAYLENTPNPYFVKCGDILIRMSFSDNDVCIDDCIERYLMECLKDRL